MHARHRDDRNAADLEDALRAAEAAVKAKLGYTIALTEKPLFDYSSAIQAGTMEATVSAAHTATGDEEVVESDDEGLTEEQMEADEEDDDDLEPEELGRRMHARGDAPPSPHAQNSHIRRGYDEAVRAAAAAAASPPAQGAATAPIVVTGVSAGSGAHGIPQTQEAIDQARACLLYTSPSPRDS